MKPVEMIVWFTLEKKPTPLKYRIMDENNVFKVIKIDKILFIEEEKLAGNRMIVYRCQSLINNVERVYELKYEIDTCRWFLFKI